MRAGSNVGPMSDIIVLARFLLIMMPRPFCEVVGSVRKRRRCVQEPYFQNFAIQPLVCKCDVVGCHISRVCQPLKGREGFGFSLQHAGHVWPKGDDWQLALHNTVQIGLIVCSHPQLSAACSFRNINAGKSKIIRQRYLQLLFFVK